MNPFECDKNWLNGHEFDWKKILLIVKEKWKVYAGGYFEFRRIPAENELPVNRSLLTDFDQVKVDRQ